MESALICLIRFFSVLLQMNNYFLDYVLSNQ